MRNILQVFGDATASSTSKHLPSSNKIKFLRSPALGGSTTAKISSFTALLITDERVSSALPTKKLQFVTPLFSALLLASLTACANSSSPKTWPHFWKMDTIIHLPSYHTDIYTHVSIYVCIHNINTRSNLNLHLPVSNLTLFQKGTYFSGIKLFNHLE